MTSTDSPAKPYTETLISTDRYDSWSTAPNGSARCHDYFTVETWLQTWHSGPYAGYTYKIVTRYISSSPDVRGQCIGSSSSLHSASAPDSDGECATGRSGGADVPAAIAALNRAGYPVRRIADDLAVADSTVYRWRAGRYQPRQNNLAALREWVEQTFAVEANAQQLDGKADLLQAAFTALETDSDREQDDAKAAELAADFAARERRRQAEQAQRNAELAQLRDSVLVAQRQRRTSGYAAADPFAVFAQQDADMAVAEGAFA